MDYEEEGRALYRPINPAPRIVELLENADDPRKAARHLVRGRWLEAVDKCDCHIDSDKCAGCVGSWRAYRPEPWLWGCAYNEIEAEEPCPVEAFCLRLLDEDDLDPDVVRVALNELLPEEG